MKKFIAAIFATSTLIAHAAPATSDIPLGGFTLEPKHSASLSLSELQDGVRYTVSCNVYALPQESSEGLDLVQSKTIPCFKLDGNESCNGVIPVDKYKRAEGQTLEIAARKSFEKLEFVNLDDTDSVGFERCVAKVIF